MTVEPEVEDEGTGVEVGLTATAAGTWQMPEPDEPEEP